jgi:putative PIN family toxin of toxin-antitoxin system
MTSSTRAPQIVIDTNVFISSLRSRRGMPYKLMSLVDSALFGINLSVPLALQYEATAKRLQAEIALSPAQIDDVIDYLCAVSRHWRIWYLWRPFLPDADDDMVLELAVAAQCEAIVTYNVTDFAGSTRFGIRALTPKMFLESIGALT